MMTSPMMPIRMHIKLTSVWAIDDALRLINRVRNQYISSKEDCDEEILDRLGNVLIELNSIQNKIQTGLD